ncbi:hypothetical protein C0216_05310 [Streptomyces globosus]|uniref:Uncharacterized protein n=1 Tax=Streptomyces globosus TaxID=68209 RepID=A0A344TWC7_9ACTN|nr:hypothetical protein C0216_05310 [Streptomyces globosus]
MAMLDTMESMESRRLRDRLVTVRASMSALGGRAAVDVVERIDDTPVYSPLTLPCDASTRVDVSDCW